MAIWEWELIWRREIWAHYQKIASSIFRIFDWNLKEKFATFENATLVPYAKPDTDMETRLLSRWILT